MTAEGPNGDPLATPSGCLYDILLDTKYDSKDPFLLILTSGVVYEFQCRLCNESYYGECVRHLAVRSGEHIGISPSTNKRMRPRRDGAVCHHLLNCNFQLPLKILVFRVMRIKSTF